MLLKKSFTYVTIFLNLFFISICFAQDETKVKLKVSQSAIAKNIENLIPIGISETFPHTVDKLYAYSQVTGAKRETSIKHLWFYRDRLMAEVTLPVKSSSWRTYSRKTILSGWKGQWRVDITTEEGLLLKSLHFTIR